MNDVDDVLQHFGVLGMKWGVRKDVKWTTKGKGARITEKARKASTKEAEAYARSRVTSATTSTGQLSKTFINQYNQKLAQLMNERVGDVESPSGKVLRYVAKRGEIGVHTALADQGYNMDQVSKGINAAGRVAYRRTEIEKI